MRGLGWPLRTGGVGLARGAPWRIIGLHGDDRLRQGGLVSGCKPGRLHPVKRGKNIKCQRHLCSGLRSRRLIADRAKAN